MNTDKKIIAEIKQRAGRFVSRELAFKHSATTHKPTRVMLGDDDRYWVVTPADAERMERMGFEHA